MFLGGIDSQGVKEGEPSPVTVVITQRYSGPAAITFPIERLLMRKFMIYAFLRATRSSGDENSTMEARRYECIVDLDQERGSAQYDGQRRFWHSVEKNSHDWCHLDRSKDHVFACRR
jgi:hypothetical protein